MEVIEAAKVLRSEKITTGDFKVIQVLEFSFFECFEKIFLGGRIMKDQVEFLHFFCQRLLRPADATFLKTGG